MTITHNNFIKKYLGRYAEYPGTSSAINQCIDIMRYYIRDVWNLDAYVIPRAATAKDAWLQAKTNSKITKIPNTPNGIPQQGDIIFFKPWFYPYTGWAGHVAIVEKADLYTITVFQQNYPTGRPCEFGKFKYRYYGKDIVYGWIRKV